MGDTFVMFFVGLVLTHGVASVWWASRVTTTLYFIRDGIRSINDKIMEHDKEIKAIWRKIDEIYQNSPPK